VNGDFGFSPGQPAHRFAQDGDFEQATVLGVNGRDFSISQEETETYIDNPASTITVLRAASGRTRNGTSRASGRHRSAETGRGP